MEGPFHAPRTIRIADLVRHEPEPEALGKSRHLRHGHHLAARAAQHHHVRVVDHHAPGRSAKIAQRVGEKHLAVETLEGRVELEEQHARIAQHGRGRLHIAPPAADHRVMRRRVVLHLLAGLEVILARRLLAAPVRSRAGGRRPSAPDRTAPLRPPPVPHGLAPDCRCRRHTAPGSVAGRFGFLRTQDRGHFGRFRAHHFPDGQRGRSAVPWQSRRILIPRLCSSRIVVRWLLLNMWFLLFDAPGEPAEFVHAHAADSGARGPDRRRPSGQPSAASAGRHDERWPTPSPDRAAARLQEDGLGLLLADLAAGLEKQLRLFENP